MLTEKAPLQSIDILPESSQETEVVNTLALVKVNKAKAMGTADAVYSMHANKYLLFEGSVLKAVFLA